MPTLFKTRRKQVTLTRVTIEELARMVREQDYGHEVAAFREMTVLEPHKRNADGSLQVEAEWERAVPRVCVATDSLKRGGQMVCMAYNGLMPIEVSNLASVDEAKGLRDYAGRLPQTLLAFVGADGRSVIIICKVALLEGSEVQFNAAMQRSKFNSLSGVQKATGGPVQSETGLNPLNSSKAGLNISGVDLNQEKLKVFHRNAYVMAQQFYTAQLNVAVDILEPRLDRVCYVSADPALYYNPQAIPFYAEAKESATDALPRHSHHEQDGDLLPGCNRFQTQMIVFQHCLSKAFELATSSDGDRLYAVEVLTLLAKFCAESDLPKAICVRLTSYHSDINTDKMLIEKIFDNAYTPAAMRKAMRRQQQLGRLLHVPESTLLMLKTNVFMQQNYEFRKNVLSGVAQYRPVAQPYFGFRDVTDEDRNTMTRRALEAGLKSWDKDIRRYVESSDIPQYDPIADYLDHLPAWDGRERLADFAARVPANDSLWQRHFPLWMRSMVAHWMGRDSLHGNALVPLLIGSQGCGKSTFCSIVLPLELRDYYNDRINFRNEYDLLNLLSSHALINIDEFDSIGQSRQPLLKYLLSKPDVKLRVPYGKALSQRRRYASFMATTNQLQPLSDPTGSRRFLCVKVEGAIDTQSRADYPQIYAQLLAEIRDGQRYWLTDEETAELIRHNERFCQVDSFEEMVHSLYRRPADGEVGEAVPIAEIVRNISRHFRGVHVDNSTMVKIGRTLSRMSFDQRHTRNGNVWMVVLQEKNETILHPS